MTNFESKLKITGHPVDENLLALAIAIATKAHEGQVDKAGKPYISHPLAVMAQMDDLESKIVAVLHDAIEDSDLKITDLVQQGFPAFIVEAIAAITKLDGEAYEDYVSRVKSNAIARKVKLADLTHNMDISRISNPTDRDFQRLAKYQEVFQELQEVNIRKSCVTRSSLMTTQEIPSKSEHKPTSPKDWAWKFWQVVPLYPYGQRRTIRQEVVKDAIWTFEQLQGIFYVVIPIRMTVVKLAAGGLLVYAPVAPTPECIRLVKELVAEHGEVKYIILPTVSGIEHKVFVGPFARCFPTAEVYVSPHQWSFPFNLPLSWLGLPWGRTKILPEDVSQVPFADQFDYAVLGSIELGVGRFAEVALFDKRSQTLLVTDTIVSIPEQPPEILQLDPYPLLFHARDSAAETITDTEVNRIRGWQRTSLFLFYFRPQVLDTVSFWQSLLDIFKAPERSRKALFGLFPFRWREDWEQSFENLRGNGRIFVAPILQTLILNRDPQTVIKWADQVASWNFVRIVPCHFDNAIAATPHDFRSAFSFLEKNPQLPSTANLPEADFEVLNQINNILQSNRIIKEAKEKI